MLSNTRRRRIELVSFGGVLGTFVALAYQGSRGMLSMPWDDGLLPVILWAAVTGATVELTKGLQTSKEENKHETKST